MARYSAGLLTGTVPDADGKPYLALFGIASIGGIIREIGAFNTTNTATNVRLVRFTAAPGSTTALVEAKYNPDSAAASCTAIGIGGSTTAGTVGDDLGYRASLGAAVGAGVIWTFGDSGLRVPPGTANGIGLVREASGTGQNLECYIVWDE